MPRDRSAHLTIVVVGVLGLLATACGGSDATPTAAGSSAPAATVSVPTPGTTIVGTKASPGCSTKPPGTILSSGTHETGGRAYRLTLPPDHEPGTPAPLILLVHGFGSNPDEFSSLTRLPDKAAAAGSIVVVPAGNNKTWETNGNGADATYVSALLDELGASLCVDEHRIFAAGFSAGAAFTIAYACAHPDRIAAITTVAVDFKLGCTKTLPILAFHGTADPLVPFQDGAIGLSLPGVKVRGTELNMGDWAALNGCDPTPTATVIGTEVTRHDAAGCDASTEVTLYEIVGGGHTWPGADPTRSIGLTTQQVDATDQAIAFFGRHHLRA